MNYDKQDFYKIENHPYTEHSTYRVVGCCALCGKPKMEHLPEKGMVIEGKQNAFAK